MEADHRITLSSPPPAIPARWRPPIFAEARDLTLRLSVAAKRAMSAASQSCSTTFVRDGSLAGRAFPLPIIGRLRWITPARGALALQYQPGGQSDAGRVTAFFQLLITIADHTVAAYPTR